LKILILNDTKVANHFGCEMVMDVFYKELASIGASSIESKNITNYRSKKFLSDLHITDDTDLVIINGEGTCHHDNGFNLIKTVELYPDIPFMLLNSVWQHNSTDPSCLKKYKYITVRETLSFNSLPKGLDNVEVVPDVAFLSDEFKDLKPFKPIHALGITDNVVGYVNNGISSKQSAKSVISKYSEFKKICCGRHHGVVAAAKMGIPFSAWPSNTHKIKGMMMDMGVEHLHFNNLNEAIKNVPNSLDERVDKYKNEATIKIKNMFRNIKSLYKS